MSNNKVRDILDQYFQAYQHSAQYKDQSRMEIALKKSEFEEHLDEMWRIYVRNPRQIVEYNKQLDVIKSTVCRVFRNKQGKHKIVIDG